MTRTLTLLSSALVAAGALVAATTAAAAPDFPILASFTECYEDQGVGWCSGTEVLVHEDGTVQFWGSMEGRWTFQGDTFLMRVTDDYDNDGVLDFKTSYRGQRSGNCIEGQAVDHMMNNLVGTFSLCS